MTLEMTSPGAATAAPGRGRRPNRRSRSTARKQRAGLAFAAPFLLLFLLVYVAPIAYSIGQSFLTQRSSGLGFGGSEAVFAGFANYMSVLSDPTFWLGFGRVLLFGIVQVPVMLAAALAIALLLDSIAARGVGFFRMAGFLPFAIPGVVSALLWSYLYLPQLSPLSQGLAALGLPIDFLSPGSALWSIANITTWSYTGYNSLIIFAALKAVSPDLFEAARLDGASEFAVATRIKIPAVRNALVLSGVLSIIGTVQLFTEPTLLQRISSAVDSQYTPAMYSYDAAFTKSDFGVASASSIVLALLAGGLSIIFFRAFSRNR